ncbi:hypothetical protein ACQ4PT_024540 [Festuca glaucescens]
MENNAALAAGAGMAASPEAELARTCRVLVVEEDPSYRATLTHMIQNRGYPVTAMASLEEGLRALRDNPEGFDVVMAIADTQGPGIDGFEFLEHARESHAVVPPLRRNLNVGSGAEEDANDGGSEGLDGSDKEDSGGSQQHKQGRTTKKTNFNSSPQQHALLVKAAEQLSGTEGNCNPFYYVLA